MRWVNALSAVVLLAYPLVVYYGLNRWGLNIIAGVLILFFLLRIATSRQARFENFKHLALAGGIAGILLVGLGAFLRREGFLLFYPVVINSVMLSVFSLSLYRPPSIIERFARLEKTDLSPVEIDYTRAVTRIWCGFFVINGLIALITCFLPRHVWMLYNGLISYFLAGILIVGERLVRRRAQEAFSS